MTISSDSWNVMEHSKTPSQQTALFVDSKYLSFGAICVSFGGKRPCEAELRVTVPRKGAPACWLVLGIGKDRTASCKGMFKSIKICLQMPLALYMAKSAPCG